MRIVDTVQLYSFQFQQNILMHHRFCYELRMSRLVTRTVTLEFVALLAACGMVRTSSVRNTSKTFSIVVVDADTAATIVVCFADAGPTDLRRKNHCRTKVSGRND